MSKASGAKRATSKPKPKLADYCDVEVTRNGDGEAIWPAPEQRIQEARDFIRECAASNKRTLVCPDKDADGLSSGVIMHRTLVALGLDEGLLDVHLFTKGTNIHDESERELMAAKDPSYIIVLDQGSRPGPPIIDNPATKSLVIDHHLSDVFPENALAVSACHYPPVATSSLLTYEICKDLSSTTDLATSLAYLACIGTHGDLGNTLKWQPPFPDMTATFKEHTKKSINDAVSLLNAPRRTAKYDVVTAWTALLSSTSPKDLLTNSRLQAARFEINTEVELNTHTPPKFSKDGRIAVLKISSQAQVHPVIATRWAGHLQSKALEIVMCANYGYKEGMVNFSCRIARCARSKDPPVNIIESLKAAASIEPDNPDVQDQEQQKSSGTEKSSASPPQNQTIDNGEGDGGAEDIPIKLTDSTNGTTNPVSLVDRLGDSFARGHKEASGGIVPVEAFEELMKLLKVGEKPDKKKEDEDGGEPKAKRQKLIDKSPQKNTLGNYFKKA